MTHLNPAQADQEAQANIGTSTYATNEEPGSLGENPEEITYHRLAQLNTSDESRAAWAVVAEQQRFQAEHNAMVAKNFDDDTAATIAKQEAFEAAKTTDVPARNDANTNAADTLKLKHHVTFARDIQAQEEAEQEIESRISNESPSFIFGQINSKKLNAENEKVDK